MLQFVEVACNSLLVVTQFMGVLEPLTGILLDFLKCLWLLPCVLRVVVVTQNDLFVRLQIEGVPLLKNAQMRTDYGFACCLELFVVVKSAF